MVDDLKMANDAPHFSLEVVFMKNTWENDGVRFFFGGFQQEKCGSI